MTKVPCLCCDKFVALDSSYRSMGVTDEEGFYPNLDGGVWFRGGGGFGSTHDLIEYRIVICDDCLNKSRDRAQASHNIMTGQQEEILEDVS